MPIVRPRDTATTETRLMPSTMGSATTAICIVVNYNEPSESDDLRTTRTIVLHAHTPALMIQSQWFLEPHHAVLRKFSEV